MYLWHQITAWPRHYVTLRSHVTSTSPSHTVSTSLRHVVSTSLRHVMSCLRLYKSRRVYVTSCPHHCVTSCLRHCVTSCHYDSRVTSSPLSLSSCASSICTTPDKTSPALKVARGSLKRTSRRCTSFDILAISQLQTYYISLFLLITLLRVREPTE